MTDRLETIRAILDQMPLPDADMLGAGYQPHIRYRTDDSTGERVCVFIDGAALDSMIASGIRIMEGIPGTFAADKSSEMTEGERARLDALIEASFEQYQKAQEEIRSAQQVRYTEAYRDKAKDIADAVKTAARLLIVRHRRAVYPDCVASAELAKYTYAQLGEMLDNWPESFSSFQATRLLIAAGWIDPAYADTVTVVYADELNALARIDPDLRAETEAAIRDLVDQRDTLTAWEITASGTIPAREDMKDLKRAGICGIELTPGAVEKRYAHSENTLSADIERAAYYAISQHREIVESAIRNGGWKDASGILDPEKSRESLLRDYRRAVTAGNDKGARAFGYAAGWKDPLYESALQALFAPELNALRQIDAQIDTDYRQQADVRIAEIVDNRVSIRPSSDRAGSLCHTDEIIFSTPKEARKLYDHRPAGKGELIPVRSKADMVARSRGKWDNATRMSYETPEGIFDELTPEMRMVTSIVNTLFWSGNADSPPGKEHAVEITPRQVAAVFYDIDDHHVLDWQVKRICNYMLFLTRTDANFFKYRNSKPLKDKSSGESIGAFGREINAYVEIKSRKNAVFPEVIFTVLGVSATARFAPDLIQSVPLCRGQESGQKFYLPENGAAALRINIADKVHEANQHKQAVTLRADRDVYPAYGVEAPQKTWNAEKKKEEISNRGTITRQRRHAKNITLRYLDAMKEDGQISNYKVESGGRGNGWQGVTIYPKY